MRLMETSPAEKDPSPTLDIIFYYLVIYPSFLKALGSYCCQSRGMKAPARTSISEITPFWRQRQDGGRNMEAMLLGGTFITELQIVEQSASLGAKWCWGRRCLLFLGWIEMGLGLEMKRDVHSLSKYNFTVTDSVIVKGLAWRGENTSSCRTDHISIWRTCASISRLSGYTLTYSTKLINCRFIPRKLLWHQNCPFILFNVLVIVFVLTKVSFKFC